MTCMSRSSGEQRNCFAKACLVRNVMDDRLTHLNENSNHTQRSIQNKTKQNKTKQNKTKQNKNMFVTCYPQSKETNVRVYYYPCRRDLFAPWQMKRTLSFSFGYSERITYCIRIQTYAYVRVVGCCCHCLHVSLPLWACDVSAGKLAIVRLDLSRKGKTT
jgi:hypothetical protein